MYFIIKKTIVTLKFFKLQPQDKTLENFTKYYHDFLLCLNLKIASVQPEEFGIPHQKIETFVVGQGVLTALQSDISRHSPAF